MKLKGSMAGIIFCFICFSGVLYAERVLIPEGTRVEVRLKADLLSTQVHEGSPVYFEVGRPVIVRGIVAVPVGAVVWGAVQSVKEGKAIKFDIEGLRLPDLTTINLRCTREKSKKASKDELKIDSDLGDTVGAPKGTEFTAYVDEAISVEGAGAATPSTPSPGPTPQPSAPAPAPAEVAPAAPTPTPAQQPTAPAPQTPRPAPQTIAPASGAPAEPVTLECFSDPTGADIVIDGDFRATTPSFLKIPPGKHHLEYQLSGYGLFSRDLDLKSGMGVQTIRATLQKKE